MSNNELSSKHCAPCDGHLRVLSESDVNRFFRQLHDDWRLGESAASLERRFAFKGFAKATYLANLCVWLADREGHHPDISFGWGYCHVLLSTHDVQGLTENDFIWAARLDVLVQ